MLQLKPISYLNSLKDICMDGYLPPASYSLVLLHQLFL